MSARIISLDLRRTINMAQSEKAFQAQVVELAKRCGWLVFHDYDSRRSEPGFPDLVLCRASDQRLIFAELKRQRGKETPAQRAWLATLASTGNETYVWRPSDWETIVHALAHNPRRHGGVA